MTPASQSSSHVWNAPGWLLAALLGGLGMLGPFAVDTYLPAFTGMGQSLSASPAGMQQTLSAYLFGFAFMILFHGALSDSFGRKPVILVGLVVFTIGSAICALSADLTTFLIGRTLQGMSSGAGMVVGRALVRDLFADAMAQKVMAMSTLFFGIAPAIAPLIGGYLYAHLNWQSIFWFLCGVSMLLFVVTWRTLPETLPPPKRQTFSAANLMRGYREVGLNARFVLLAFASGIPFNGFFVYILSAPAYLSEAMGLAPTDFFWFFIATVSGIMGGAVVSGRFAGKVSSARQIRLGFIMMLLATAMNLIASIAFTPRFPWAFVPIMLYAFGWSTMVSAVTILVLDLFPARRGMASSLQSFLGSMANGIVAAIVSPLVMHSVAGLAIASACFLAIGLVTWTGYRMLSLRHHKH